MTGSTKSASGKQQTIWLAISLTVKAADVGADQGYPEKLKVEHSSDAVM